MEYTLLQVSRGEAGETCFVGQVPKHEYERHGDNLVHVCEDAKLQVAAGYPYAFSCVADFIVAMRKKLDLSTPLPVTMYEVKLRYTLRNLTSPAEYREACSETFSSMGSVLDWEITRDVFEDEDDDTYFSVIRLLSKEHPNTWNFPWGGRLRAKTHTLGWREVRVDMDIYEEGAFETCFKEAE